MTPPALPPVHEQMLDALLCLRASGTPFDRAWALAFTERVRWPHDTVSRRAHKEAALFAREEWRAAYEGRETRLSRALAAIAEEPPAEESRESGGGVLAA